MASGLGCTGSVTPAVDPTPSGSGSQPGAPGSGGNSGTGSIVGTGGTAAGGNGGEVPDTFAAACTASNNALNAGLTPARRLTRDEFNNTVRDLLGATGNSAERLADDEKIGPFYSNAIAPITDLLVQQHSETASILAIAAKARMKTISPCDLSTDTTTTCATNFVTTFGRRAFRRPLDAAEVTKFVSLYTLGKQGTDGALNGFRLVVETMLQSPFFLYHHDVGATGVPQAGTVALTPYELASRLSYFLWNSMPDETLFATAASGSISQEATISSQVQRMLADNRAAATIAMFHRQWLDLSELADQPKDATSYPRYNPQLVDAMEQETALFTDYVVRKGDGLLKTLLTSNMAFPQGGLFSVYGATQPAGYVAGTPVMLNSSQRAGLLTQAAFLTRWSHNNQTSPVHRGRLIRLNIMCGYIPPPPNDVNTTPPPPSPATSTRERFAQHSADPNCAGCHLLMDSIGLGLENYDAIGAYRTTDGLGDVDATGNIVQASADLAGPFKGALELASKLAQSKDVANCVASQWFRFSMGRMESTNDSCSIMGIRDGFKTSGGNVRDLISKIAVSPSFRNVRINGG
ncbi:MAG: DUF1592 domain-containing protein [Verrucomicrobiota bacterium]